MFYNKPKLGRKTNKKKTKLAVNQSVQSLSHVWLFAIPWTAAHQASLSITKSRNLLKLMSIESVMPSSYLILCRPLLLPPSIFPSIRVFSNESGLCIRWPKYCSFIERINIFVIVRKWNTLQQLNYKLASCITKENFHTKKEIEFKKPDPKIAQGFFYTNLRNQGNCYRRNSCSSLKSICWKLSLTWWHLEASPLAGD